MDINSVVVEGRLAADAELTYSSQGAAVMNFTLLVCHVRHKDGSEDVSQVKCKAFGKVAEEAGRFLVKGTRAVVSGYIKEDRWSADGLKSQIVINCSQIRRF